MYRSIGTRILTLLLALVLLYAPLAAEGDEARTVSIRIHDYAHIRDGALARAQEVVRGMYGAIGVRTDWLSPLQLSEGVFDSSGAPDRKPADLMEWPSARIECIRRTVVEELEERLGTSSDRTVYVGDGSSDVHVMLHVNNRDGLTIAVSENRLLSRITRSTVISDNAFSVLIPILERIVGWRSGEIRELFESNALHLHQWEKAWTGRPSGGPNA